MAESSQTALSAFIIVCCIWGIAVSVYALHVEHSREKDKNYKAMCDIGPRVSCSTALTSRYRYSACTVVLACRVFIKQLNIIRNCL